MTHSLLTFVNFGGKKLTYSLFSSCSELNVQQNSVRVPCVDCVMGKVTYVYSRTLLVLDLHQS